jgi:hypothetical protein
MNFEHSPQPILDERSVTTLAKYSPEIIALKQSKILKELKDQPKLPKRHLET